MNIINTFKTFLDYRLRKLWADWPRPELTSAPEEVDVVIPTVPKDFKTLPWCVNGVRHSIANVSDIYIVAPESVLLREFCIKENLKFVEEKTVLGFSAKELNLEAVTPEGRHVSRNGWLFQQLLKLSGNIGTCENFICVDSDHVLIRPLTFLAADHKPVFYMSDEHHEPYYDNIHRLIGKRFCYPMSYVAHKMIFNKTKLEELRCLIETRWKKDWIQAILDSYDRTIVCAFSEFELYGNYVQGKYRRPWKDKLLKYAEMTTYEEVCQKYKGYNSVTFPSWYNQDTES